MDILHVPNGYENGSFVHDKAVPALLVCSSTSAQPQRALHYTYPHNATNKICTHHTTKVDIKKQGITIDSSYMSLHIMYLLYICQMYVHGSDNCCLRCVQAQKVAYQHGSSWAQWGGSQCSQGCPS